MAQKIEFTKQERNVIGEYIYSCGTDILIKSDCLDLIEVLHKHDVIKQPKSYIDAVDKREDGIVDKLNSILYATVSENQIDEIMKGYFGNN